MAEPIMQLNHLVKEYDTKRGPILAADDVSLTLNKGDILCLVGESGSGKTTVARMAAGMITRIRVIGQGTAAVAGQSMPGLSGVAMVPAPYSPVSKYVREYHP